jgi:hypothetical protein
VQLEKKNYREITFFEEKGRLAYNNCGENFITLVKKRYSSALFHFITLLLEV